MRRILIALSLVASLAACSSDGVVDTVFDPCSPLILVPGLGTQERELQAIDEAILAWSHVLPVRIEVGEPSDTEPGLSIQFDSGDTFYRALYLDNTGVILIGRDKLVPDDLGLAIAHELGHAFGLLHVSSDERSSVMNVGNLEVEPTREDGVSVRALWQACTGA